MVSEPAEDSEPLAPVPGDATTAQEESLEVLGRVYLEALARRSGDVPPASASPATSGPDSDSNQAPDAEPPKPDEPADTVAVAPRSILEAMLFVGSEDGGLTPRKAASLIRGVSPQEVEQLVDELNASYENDDSAFRIQRTAEGLKLTLQNDLDAIRQQMLGRIREARLGHAAIEVLAVVAYHQPVTHDDVDRLRNRQSGPVLNLLVRRDLLAVERDAENRRVKHYRTTPRFLKLFGMDSIEDLPQATTPQGADFLDEG